MEPQAPKTFSFTQIKPKLAEANPETTVAAWFKVTHPHVPLANDNFKNDESLDNYLGLVDGPSESEETSFLLNRPMNHRSYASENVHSTQQPKWSGAQKHSSLGISKPTHYPTHAVRPLCAKAKNVHNNHPNPPYQRQTGYLYPGKKDERKAPRECNVHSLQYPRANLTSKNPETTPTASPNKEKTSAGNKGWVTYTYEYDREPINRKSPQRTPTETKNGWATYDYESENYHKRIASTSQGRSSNHLWYYPKISNRAHSERVSMFYKRDPALYCL